VLDGLKFWKRGEGGAGEQGFSSGPDLGGFDDPMPHSPDPLAGMGEDPLQHGDPLAVPQGHPYGSMGMPMRAQEQYPPGGALSHLTTRNASQRSPMAPDPEQEGAGYPPGYGGYEAQAPPQSSRDRDMELVLAKLDAIRHALERLENIDQRLRDMERRLETQQRRAW
jgi:hypothetical protein